MAEPLKIFVSYSHKDKRWLERLRVHLRPLVHEGKIDPWDDTRIKAGQRWKEEVQKALAVADAAILLISADFLASDFIVNSELPDLLDAAEKENLLILNVIVSRCRYKQTKKLSLFQAVNDPKKPLARMSKWQCDDVFVRVTELLDEELQRPPQETAPPAAPERETAPPPPPPAVVEQEAPPKRKKARKTVRSPAKPSPATLPETWQNALGMPFALIPAGAFEMGSKKGHGDEKPVHRVTISQPFYLGMHTVTQQHWKGVMNTEPWKGKSYVQEGDDYPAVYVSWEDAQAFIEKLNARDDAGHYRLPTEAEWEYACRAGSTTEYCFGDDAGKLGEYARYRKNARDVGEQYAHRVGQKRPNAWGLYDMHGNVWEWVEDWYGGYPSEAVTDPPGPGTGSSRVIRGGGWYGPAEIARSAFRYDGAPAFRFYDLGFRLVRMAL